jgi:hypothetical protein
MAALGWFGHARPAARPQRKPRKSEETMVRIGCLAVLLLAGSLARAQDVAGIELCTRESRMDRRTGCLQSNVDYLHKLIAKNAADAQQKLSAAAGEIGALKAAIATLQAAVAAQQASIDKLQAAARKPDASKPDTSKPGAPASKPDAK